MAQITGQERRIMFLKEFFKGIKSYVKGHRVISKHKLWRYMIAPGILSLLYTLALIILGIMYFGDISGYINDNWIPEFMKWKMLETITSVLLWVLLFLIGFITYKPVVLILFSPLLSYLSELTENAIYGRPSPDFEFKQMLKDIIRGLVITIRNLALTILFILPAWLLVFIPVIGPVISTILISCIMFYYDGFGLVYLTLERKRYSVSESIKFVKDSRPRVMGVGMGFFLMMLVPLLGWFAAPSYGAVAATIAALEKIDTRDAAG